MKLLPSVKIIITAGGKRHSLALIPQPFKGKYWLRYNGKMSQKMPECTITKLMDECRRIIVKSQEDKWKEENCQRLKKNL